MTLWQSLLFSCCANDRELARAFATGLVLPSTSVRIVDALEDLPPLSDHDARLIIVRWFAGGDFRLLLDVYIRDPQVLGRIQEPDETIATVRQLCALLDCDALLSDDSPDVLSWLRLRSSGEIDAVLLDPDRLERDEYVVSDVSPVQQRPVA